MRQMMKKSGLMALVACMVMSVSAPAMASGPIQSACLNSGRSQASRQLCGCIQQVADMTLRGSDQRRAASFFRDPERAQKVKMSKSAADDAFWERYSAFGEQAEAFCAAY
jgi:hypothetical protein